MLAVRGRLAQTPAQPTAPVTGMKPDRTTAPASARPCRERGVKRQKRAECRAKAKAEKVRLKRPAYVKNA